MADKIHFEIVSKKPIRRHSAPATSDSNDNRSPANILPYFRRPFDFDFHFHFGVFFEDESESCSSLELDTSNSPKGLPGMSQSNNSLTDSYVNLPSSDCEHLNTNQTWRLLSLWPFIRSILLGHLAAAFLATTIASSDFLNSTPYSVENGQNLPFYVSLALFWTSKLALRNRGRDLLEIVRYSGLRYFFLAVLHVQVNYLLLTTFGYDSYLGNQIIDCVAAILSLFIAYILLEVRFRAIHFSGFLTTLIGSFIFSALELSQDNQPSTFNGALGDILRLGSGVCLAYSSAAQEIIVKATDAVEYTGMIALIATFICTFQTFAFRVLDWKEKNPFYWMNLFVYSVAQFSFHSLMPKVVRDTGATGFHLVLVTAGFYSHCIAAFTGETHFQVAYVVPYAVVMAGSSLFAIKKTSIGTHNCFPIKTVIMK